MYRWTLIRFLKRLYSWQDFCNLLNIHFFIQAFQCWCKNTFTRSLRQQYIKKISGKLLDKKKDLNQQQIWQFNHGSVMHKSFQSSKNDRLIKISLQITHRLSISFLHILFLPSNPPPVVCLSWKKFCSFCLMYLEWANETSSTILLEFKKIMSSYIWHKQQRRNYNDINLFPMLT